MTVGSRCKHPPDDRWRQVGPAQSGSPNAKGAPRGAPSSVFPGRHAARRRSLVRADLARLEGGTEDVAERRAAVGRAELRHGFLLSWISRALIDRPTLRVLRSNWVTRASTFSPAANRSGRLLGPLARQVGATDERGDVGVDDAHLQAAFLHLEDLAGDHGIATQFAGRLHRVVAELLHAEADALLLHVDVEDHGLDDVTLGEFLDDLLAGTVPVEIRQVTMPSTSPSRPMNRPNSVLFFDLALDHRTDRVLLDEGLPGFCRVCLSPREMRRLTGSTSSTITSTSCDVETILPGWTFFLVHDISETWIRPSIPGSSFHEGAVVGDVGDAAVELHADRVLRLDAVPGIGLELLHAQLMRGFPG